MEDGDTTTDGGCVATGATGVDDTTDGVDDGTGVDDGRTVVDTAESEKDRVQCMIHVLNKRFTCKQCSV